MELASQIINDAFLIGVDSGTLLRAITWSSLPPLSARLFPYSSLLLGGQQHLQVNTTSTSQTTLLVRSRDAILNLNISTPNLPAPHYLPQTSMEPREALEILAASGSSPPK